MGEVSPSDKWGTRPQSEEDQGSKPLQTVQSKFLEAVKKYAEARYVELVVVLETPNSGYGYIQKKSGFSNLYSFHFEFGSESATFYLGTEKLATALPEEKRVIDFSGGTQLEGVLSQIREQIDAASKGVFPELGALSSNPPAPSTTSTPATLSSLSAPTPPTDAQAARVSTASVWGHDESRTKSNLTSTYHQASRLPGIIATVAIIVVLFLIFVPVVHATGEVGVCPGNSGSCPNQYSATYYASVTKTYSPFGGEYYPSGLGWSIHAFVGSGTNVNGATVYGFAVWQYYFVV